MFSHPPEEALGEDAEIPPPRLTEAVVWGLDEPVLGILAAARRDAL